MRPYQSTQGWPVLLTVVYAGTTRRSLHFPEVCLVGQGWEIAGQETTPVGFSFTAKRLILAKGNRREAVLYWFKTGEEVTGNFFLNSWHWTKNQLLSGTSTSAMIKVSAPIGSQDPEKIFAILEDFALKFSPIMMEKIR
jgi:EpsI family protein